MPQAAKPLLEVQHAALRQLQARGFSNEQLAQLAKISRARLAALMTGNAQATSACELALVTRGPQFVKGVIDQQTALSFLFTHKVLRSDLAFALGVTIETLKFWDGGRADVIRLASPKEHELLLTFAQRARELVGGRAHVDLSSDDELAKIFGERLRPRAHHRAGVRSEGRKQDLVEVMTSAGLWPPAVRARTLSNLLAQSGLTSAQLMRRLCVSRNLFFSLLNPASDALIEPDVVLRVQELQAQVSQGAGPNNLRDRFNSAMTALLGEQAVKVGFAPRDPALARVYPQLAQAMNWSERTVRRHLPPYTNEWWEGKRLPAETVERLEIAADRLGCLISPAGTAPPSQGLTATPMSSPPSL